MSKTPLSITEFVVAPACGPTPGGLFPLNSKWSAAPAGTAGGAPSRLKFLFLDLPLEGERRVKAM